MTTISGHQEAYIQQQWARIRTFAWMNEDAWSAIQHPEIKKDLFEWLNKSDGNPRNHRLLLHAIFCRVTPLVSVLLSAGATALPQPYGEGPFDSRNFWSPLCTAVSASPYPYRPELFDLLLAHGANPDDVFPHASILNRSVVAAAIDSPPAMADILGRGLDPDMVALSRKDHRDRDAETALQHAVLGAFDKHTPRHHRRQIVRRLIAAGADLERPDRFGRSPLMLSVLHTPCLAPLLLKAGSRLDCRDRDGQGLHALLGQMEGDARLAASFTRRLAMLEEQVLDASTAPAPVLRQPTRL